MRCQSRRFYLLIALLCTSFVAMGQSKLADFDGTWKLNAAKSDGGPRPLAEGMMVKWTSNDAEFDVHHQMPLAEQSQPGHSVHKGPKFVVGHGEQNHVRGHRNILDFRSGNSGQ